MRVVHKKNKVPSSPVVVASDLRPIPEETEETEGEEEWTGSTEAKDGHLPLVSSSSAKRSSRPPRLATTTAVRTTSGSRKGWIGSIMEYGAPVVLFVLTIGFFYYLWRRQRYVEKKVDMMVESLRHLQELIQRSAVQDGSRRPSSSLYPPSSVTSSPYTPSSLPRPYAGTVESVPSRPPTVLSPEQVERALFHEIQELRRAETDRSPTGEDSFSGPKFPSHPLPPETNAPVRTASSTTTTPTTTAASPPPPQEINTIGTAVVSASIQESTGSSSSFVPLAVQSIAVPSSSSPSFRPPMASRLKTEDMDVVEEVVLNETVASPLSQYSSTPPVLSEDIEVQ